MGAAGKTKMRYGSRRGQTALEYILVFAVLLVALAAAIFFISSSGRIAKHDIDVICSDRY
jgi:uncharacterized protein (UPF0333 family)